MMKNDFNNYICCEICSLVNLHYLRTSAWWPYELQVRILLILIFAIIQECVAMICKLIVIAENVFTLAYHLIGQLYPMPFNEEKWHSGPLLLSQMDWPKDPKLKATRWREVTLYLVMQDVSNETEDYFISILGMWHLNW